MNVLGIIKDLGDSILGKGNKILDTVITNEEEKSKAKEMLSSLVLSSVNRATEITAKVILAELNGNWLQRSWRPIVMLNFSFIVSYVFFFQPAFFYDQPQVILPQHFWKLLELGIGGYVIGRSVEKIAGKVTENIDLPFLKKKDRKL